MCTPMDILNERYAKGEITQVRTMDEDLKKITALDFVWIVSWIDA